MKLSHACTKGYCRALCIAFGVAVGSAQAEISQTPLSVTQAVEPRVLFVMSNDHQLYYKAYTDWNDLDNDGVLETSYKHSFDYFGYFDSYKCYDYDSSDNRFEPKAISTDKYCDSVNGAWSGNFLNWATMSRMDIVRKVLYGGYRSTDTASNTVLERAHLPTDAHSFAKYYAGVDINKLTPHSVADITLCNTTYESSGSSEDSTSAPLIRVANGDFRYWNANERWQCTWDNERGDNSSGSNSTGSETSDPNKASNGLSGGNLQARVQVCVSGLLGSEACKRYPDGNYKPTGLLHEYGEDDTLLFGLLTGSYQKNKSGGVLRKNAVSFTDEVNEDSDGTFTGADGIVKTLNKFRIARYYYGSGSGDGLYNNTDSCPWNITSFNEGQCSNWGNPISEMYLESIRYFAGLSANSAFSATDSGYISGLVSATWSDPLSEESWCARCNVILINASDISFDDNAVSMSGLPGTPSASALTDTVGDLEELSGAVYFVGENGSDTNQLCTAKTVNSLGDVRGTCPGSPRLSGTYYSAGIAHWAATHDIRTDLDEDQRVATRAISLVPGAPNISVPVPGSDNFISILPACQNTKSATHIGCGLVDFKIISQDLAAGTGSFYVNWESSEQGADYDSDMLGVLEYAIDVAANTLTISTKTHTDSTSAPLAFGYILSGTTQDGFHAHSGIKDYSFTDPTYDASNPDIGSPGCSHCVKGDSVSSATYLIGASDAGLLNDPLWYAAKYGSFRDLDGDGRPDNGHADYGNQEWDADDDGVPDGYFQVNNPAALGPALANVLNTVAGVSSTASVVANSVALQTGTYIYQARFDSADWSGDLVAFPLNLNGSVMQAAWQAREMINTQNPSSERVVLTYNPEENTDMGVAFRWDSLSDAQQSVLRSNPQTAAEETEETGQQRLNYLRGSHAEELQNGGVFRNREYVMGDIVNSEPAYVGAPPFFYPSSLDGGGSTYDSFKSTHENRQPVLYVGGNDGMLHGVETATGTEVMAYVPRSVYANLNQLTSVGYQESHRYFVDGSPTVGDAYLSGSGWRTVLVEGLRAGGKGLFALDVTNPVLFAENQAASLVLWDITVEDEDFADLGYSYSRAAIVRLPDENNDGKWVAIFGNGYGSASGNAVLYVVDLKTGERLARVEAHGGPGNGLSSVAPVDVDGDFQVDYVYAGDLLGNIWRFEPETGNNASGWDVSFTQGNSATPLFHATDVNGNALPITTRPEVGRHPNGGYMVYFGTGKYFEIGDNTVHASPVNSFFGVWDKDDGTDEIQPEHLQTQVVTGQVAAHGYDLRLISKNLLVWHTGNGLPSGDPVTSHMGWKLALPDSGEMQVTDSILHAERVIFTSLVPSDAACDFGGTGWLMEVDALSGGPAEDVVFDLNGDKLFDDDDLITVTDDQGTETIVVPAGKKSEVGIIQKPVIMSAGSVEYKYASGSNQAQIEITVENPNDSDLGRQSWIQLQ